MSLGSLTVDLAANITRFERALTKAERLAEKRSKGIQRTFTRLAGGIGAVLVGAGFVKAVDGALGFADAVDKAAARAGIGTTKLQELRFAADQMGISTMQLDDGMRRFTRRMGVALEGGSFAKDFANLGVSIRDASGKARSSEDVFNDVTVAMAKVETQAQRSAFAAQLFGDDAGPQLSLLMKDGIATLDEFAARAHLLGVIIDEDMIKRGVEAKDELAVLSKIIETKLVVAVVNAAPAIEAMATGFIDLTVAASKFFGGLNALSGAEVVNTIETLMNSITDAKATLAETLEREESSALKDVLLDQFLPSSETIEEEVTRLEGKLLEAQLRLGELNFSKILSGGDDDEGRGFISGQTNDEIDGELAYIEGVLEQAAKAHEKLAKQRIKDQQFIDSHIKSSEQSIASNSISLLQTLGRERKGFALAALALQKGLAIAEATTNTAVAVTAALKYDPTGALAARVAMLGKIQVGLIAATGLAQASSISSSGGGGGSAPLGSASNPITTTSQDSSFGGEETGGGGTVGTITINVNGVITEEIVQDLIVPAIQEATNDKDVILFRPDSRQAQELVVS